jgi:hypothetical protein
MSSEGSKYTYIELGSSHASDSYDADVGTELLDSRLSTDSDSNYEESESKQATPTTISGF